jgi:hypothetical protein
MDIIIEQIGNGWILDLPDGRRLFYNDWTVMTRAVVVYLDQNNPGPAVLHPDGSSRQVEMFEEEG